MPGAFTIGGRHVDFGLRIVTHAGQQIRLEPKVMQVLELLAERPGEVVSKERLLQTVWAETFVGDEVLSRAISELRRALDDDPKSPRYIQTIPKAGYRLIAPVTVPDARPAHAPAAASQSRRPRPRLLRIGLWSGLIILSLTGIWLLNRGRHSTGASSSEPVTSLLATLPGTVGTPSFSPDASRVTFAWGPTGTESRIVVKLVGDEPVQELTRGFYDDHPAWSPDGRSIAFLRDTGIFREATALSGVYVMPAIGGPVRQVYSGAVCDGITWAPDGRALVFSAIRSKDELCTLYRLSLDTFATARVTPSHGWDWTPGYSPDGKSIAFVRQLASTDLYVVPTTGGSPRQLTSDGTLIYGPPVWTPDSKAIVFESSRRGSPELWRVPAEGGEPQRLEGAANASGGVALASQGQRLAYVQGRAEAHLTVYDLRNPDRPGVRIAESTRTENDATFSSDGRRLTFASTRASEARDIWVTDVDGSNPIRLTFRESGGNGSPRWSPDDQWIAFDSIGETQLDVLVVRSTGGPLRPLTSRGAGGCCPAWSRDGKWVYISSDRTGKDQVWKLRADGGAAVQITKEGGGGGYESADGRYFYYSKGNQQAGVWRVPANGGTEEPVLPDDPSGLNARSWFLLDDGIYYVSTRVGTQVTLRFFRFSSRLSEKVRDLPMAPSAYGGPALSISPDRRTALTCFEAPYGSEMLIIDNFRWQANSR